MFRTAGAHGGSRTQAYGSSRIAGGKVQQILNWPGSFETFRKIPTCLLYDERGAVAAWGIQAKTASPQPGATKCEWCARRVCALPAAECAPGSSCSSSRTRCATSTRSTRASRRSRCVPRPPCPRERSPHTQPGKQAVDLIVDFLACLWEYAKQQITREIGAVADLGASPPLARGVR